MFKLVLFDFDGTTLDSDNMLVATFFDLYKKYYPNKEFTIEHILTFSGPPMEQTLRQEFPDLKLEDIMAEYLKVSMDYYPTTIKLYPGVEELLIKLKNEGISTGLFTSRGRYTTEFAFDLLGIQGYFDHVICGDEVKERKPSPEGLLKAMEHFNIINKEDVLYIGDSNFDYLAARNAGIKFAIVNWSARKDTLDGEPDYVITDFNKFFEEVSN